MSSTPSVVVEAFLAGLVESVSAGLPDGVAAAFVFVVGCDVADAFVEPDGVVVLTDHVEFGW